MSLISEVTRLTNLRNRIRTKLINIGVLSSSSANLEQCTIALEGIEYKFALFRTPTITLSDSSLIEFDLLNAGYLASLNLVLISGSISQGNIVDLICIDNIHNRNYARTVNGTQITVMSTQVVPSTATYRIDVSNENAVFNGDYRIVVATITYNPNE